MGNNVIKDVIVYETEKEYTFVGRQNEIINVKELLNTKNVVQIYGMTKIGKSRILVKLLKDLYERRTCFYQDFDECVLETEEDVIKLLHEFQREIEAFAADKGEIRECMVNVSSAIKQLKDTLKSCSADLSHSVLFLDNLDSGFTNKLVKDELLTVLKEISTTRGCEIKVVFTTSDKITIPGRTFGELEIGALNDEHIKEILDEIVRTKGMTSDDFDFGEEILSKENEIYMDIIAKECEGLPFIANMVAMELIADEGMLTPVDVVQLLFTQRVKSLSLEYYPPVDRIEMFKKDIEKVDELDVYFFKTLNQNLDENNRKSLEILRSEFLEHTDKTKLEVTKCFKLLTQPCIVRFLGKTREVDMHGIFRHCICEITETDSIDDDVFRQLLMDNAKRYGLELTDKHIDSPKLLEEYVEKLSEKESFNETLIGCESGQQTDPQFNMEEQRGANYLHMDSPETNVGFHAQVSDQSGLFGNSDKAEHSVNKMGDFDQSGISPRSGNSANLNVNNTASRPKLNDLKVNHSIEDNTAVPAERSDIIMKGTRSNGSKTSSSSQIVDLHEDNDADETTRPISDIALSPTDQFTVPKILNITAENIPLNMEPSVGEKDVETEIKYNDLAIKSLLNISTNTHETLNESDIKQCHRIHSNNIPSTVIEESHESEQNTLGLDTLLDESNHTKQMLSDTQYPKSELDDRSNGSLTGSSVCCEIAKEVGNQDPTCSVESMKLMRLKSFDIDDKQTSQVTESSITSANDLAISYRVNHDSKCGSTAGTKHDAIGTSIDAIEKNDAAVETSNGVNGTQVDTRENNDDKQTSKTDDPSLTTTNDLAMSYTVNRDT